MMLEDVIEKAAYARPGYVLAAFKEAALPVYVVTARVITLEKKPLSPIEEGCLRSVEAGLSHPEEICQFLGLPSQLIKSILAGLNSRELINYVRPVGNQCAQVLLTDKGRTVLAHLKTVEPEERLVRITFDPLLKKVVFIPTSGLFRPKEVKDRGWLEIPLCGEKRPEIEDIPLTDIDKVVQRLPRAMDEMRELLAVRRIERRELQFTPAAALYYRSNDGKDVQIGFYREDGFSVAHETAFSSLGGPELIGALHVLQPPEIPVLAGQLSQEQAAASLAVVDDLERKIAAVETAASEARGQEQAAPMAEASKKDAEEAKSRLRAMTQRPVRCHEHPRLLLDAITKTKERLLIISPWITHHVVNDMFVRSLEALLRNGVAVHIGYGLTDEDGGRGNDKAKQKEPITYPAQKEFDALKKRYDNLTLKFVGNTHRKMLVSDDRFAVVTSFNWLSFKGDPRSKARDEFGILVSEPIMLEAIFNDGRKLIDEGYDHPTVARTFSTRRGAA